MSVVDYQTFTITKKLSNIFIISDHHFNHKNIIKFCNRPFKSVDEMNTIMIDNHNSLVRSKDTVYLLGDFAYSNHMHFIHALNGRKILIIGNHDRMSKQAYDQFTEVIGTPKQPGILQRNIDGRSVVMSHFPLYSWTGSNRGSWHFYGHCHGRKYEPILVDVNGNFSNNAESFSGGLSCAVDVDVWDYKPIPWEVLKAKMIYNQKCLHSIKNNKNSYKNTHIVNYPKILAESNNIWRLKDQNFIEDNTN